MAYTKTTWANGTSPKISADNLNNIENGIKNNDTSIGNISNLSTTATDLVGAVNEVINNTTIDSDSNYIKLPDGTLICWGKTDIFDITYGTVVEREINLPESFVDTNYIVTCSITNGRGFWANGVEFKGEPLTTSSIKLYAGNYISGGLAQEIQGSFIAIGRWK